MSDLKELLDREARRVDEAPDALGSVLRRRDRERRNQRITAGVVGIAVFVAAVWIVTSGLSFDRIQTPAAPGSETGPAETAPPPAPASAAPDVVKEKTCSDGARMRLVLMDIGERIKVQFEVHRSPVGHEWRITLRHSAGFPVPPPSVFRGTSVASDSGDFVVKRRIPDVLGADAVDAHAVDTQTDQVCGVNVRI